MRHETISAKIARRAIWRDEMDAARAADAALVITVTPCPNGRRDCDVERQKVADRALLALREGRACAKCDPDWTAFEVRRSRYITHDGVPTPEFAIGADFTDAPTGWFLRNREAHRNGMARFMGPFANEADAASKAREMQP